MGQLIQTAPGTTLTFWTALTGGSQITDLTDLSSNPITSVTADANGEIPSFFGPSGTWRMAVDASGGAGPRVWITAVDEGDYLTTLRTYLVSIAGG